MKYVDVHAHLESKQFDGDIGEVVGQCEEKEIVVVNSGVNPMTNRKVLEMERKFPETLKCSFGLFPIDCIAADLKMSSEESDLREVETFDLDEELDWIREHKDECVAIGEVGLDYADEEVKENQGLKEKQIENFRKIIKVAKELDKPLVVHTRKAEADAIEVLEDSGYRKVVLHSFCGSKKLIRQGIENGWYFSISPKIKRLQQFQMMVSNVPLEQLLTETDAPWNSPEFGERNEPVNVLVTIEEIARIKDLDVEIVREKILENTLRVFGI